MDEAPIRYPDDAGPGSVPSDETQRPLIIDEDRYSRLRLIPWWRQDRLAAARVLVVGAGALGNEVIKNLALLGVGTVTVIDFDEVETSNLSRSVLFRAEDGGQPKADVAARRALEINPEIAIIPIEGDVITALGLGHFADADVVIACLDNREARLWVNRQCWKVGTPWIDAGIQEIQGVVKIFVPPDSACYECAMTALDYQLLNLSYSCPLLRREDMQQGRVPTTPTIASMIASLQVQEALKLLHGLPVDAGTALVFNGVTNQFYKTKLPFRDDCLSHEFYPEPMSVPLGSSATVAEVFAVARHSLEGPLTLALDRDLVVSLECPRCGWHSEVFRPRTRVTQAESICPTCHEPARPEVINAVSDDSALASRKLAEVGVPAYDIVRVDGATESGFFLLSGSASLGS